MQNHIVCLKWGNKYSAAYVNRLYAMIKRNLTLPFQFHCMTEISQELNPEINVLPLETSDLVSWWYKLHIFKKDFYGLQGQLLFIDLDMVIIKNLDEFFNYSPNDFCIMPNLNGDGTYGSCMMRLEIGKYSSVWENFEKDKKAISERLHGDQDWIYEQIPNAALWPKHWIQSFKWQCDSKTSHSFGFLNNLIKPFTAGEAKLPPDAKVIAFHGKPDPEDIVDSYYGKFKKASWLKKYWCE